MLRSGRKREWTILVFCLFVFGISPPLIHVFDKPDLVFNLPLSFLYLFGLWALMIVFMALSARQGRRLPAQPETTNRRSKAEALRE